ncbi:MAG TPA: hypothetical protein VK168_19330 [Saprospiraceae bacterium]|nr:hypothetical protein [Saprospiraceae bacterium]
MERSRQVLEKSKTAPSQNNKESIEMYFQHFRMEEERHEWEASNNQLRSDINLINVIEHLDLFYFNYRIELVNRFLLQKKAMSLPEFNLAVPELTELLGKSKRLDITYKIFQLLNQENPSGAEVLELNKILQDMEDKFSFSTLDNLFAYLRSLCTLSINAGKTDFITVLHEINKNNLEKGYLFLFGKLPFHSYLNLVQVALRSKDISWAKEVTERFRNSILEPGDYAFSYKLNLAQCFFEENRYDDAFDSLPNVSSNSHYHHVVRRLELKILYELKSDLLLYKIDSFRKFVERTALKLLASSYREMDLNFLKILHQLAQSPPKDKARSARLIKRIEEKKFIAERTWLLEKARELG